MNMVCCPRCRGRGEVIENRWTDDAMRQLMRERKVMKIEALAAQYGVTYQRIQAVLVAARKRGIRG